MARFDVCQVKFSPFPYVLKVQSGLFDDLHTCVVIPVLPLETVAREEMQKLKPVLQINGCLFILMTSDITVLRKKEIGDVVANIEDQRHVIVDAIDFLFQGF